MTSGRLVILAGPSCVGKSPLSHALARFYPDLWTGLQPLVLYNDRAPRPGEQDGVDYHFRSREAIEALRGQERYAVLEVRGDLQALDLPELAESLAQGDVFFEGNPFVGALLMSHPALAGVEKLGVFMSPLAPEELTFLEGQSGVKVEDVVAEVMRRKLLRRARRMQGELSLRDLEEVERRATSAYRELAEAHQFQYVIANHDGEDSDNWEAFYYPLGEARLALLRFVELLTSR
jgi:guanylate kinase